jgi:hypothetical protein
VGHIQRGAMIVTADQFDGMNQFFGIGIVQQEGKALDGLVSEPAAARFFPGQMLVKKLNRMARPGQLLAAHRAGRSAADDRNVCHLGIFLTASDSVAGSQLHCGTRQAARPAFTGHFK